MWGRGQEAQGSVEGPVSLLWQVVRPSPPREPAALSLSGSQPGLERLSPSRGAPLPRCRPGHPHSPPAAPAGRASGAQGQSRAPLEPDAARGRCGAVGNVYRSPGPVGGRPGPEGLIPFPKTGVMWGPTLSLVWPLTTAGGEADGAGSDFPQ